MRKPEIITTDHGFAIVTGNGADTVSLNDMSQIAAYKLDEPMTDLVCCDIVTGHGDGEQIRTIQEKLPGFDALMARFETLPGFDRRWRNEVIAPLRDGPHRNLQPNRHRMTHSQTDSKRVFGPLRRSEDQINQRA